MSRLVVIALADCRY